MTILSLFNRFVMNLELLPGLHFIATFHSHTYVPRSVSRAAGLEPRATELPHSVKNERDRIIMLVVERYLLLALLFE